MLKKPTSQKVHLPQNKRMQPDTAMRFASH
ncbi:uncharacterized protein METZ01_LOCUS18901 [marine metagenome]|uniref:Uncharacterized protein n=1 Tax=marine metagenome TaxID=408172 RepID=A0A381PIN6_9ZZZZ